MKRREHSRRTLLRSGLYAAALGLSGVPDFAAPSQSERILVCVYLLGGNDGNNTVVPLEDYGNYMAVRGDLTIPAAHLLPAAETATGAIAFHPAMPQARALYDSGQLAVIANTGWASRFDSHRNNPDLAYFPTGFATANWAVTALGSASLRAGGNVITGFPAVSPYADSSAASGLVLSGRGADAEKQRLLAASANPGAPFAVEFPQSSVGLLLRQAAGVIRSGLGGIAGAHFFVPHSGYDTHSDQLNQQAARLGELSQAIAAFHAAMLEIGVSRGVTLYTDSDFGRALVPNSIGGSEHGWGNHQLVAGGSVAGGRVYGSFPSLALGGPSDVARNGVWTPTLGKSQYLASLGAWAGLSVAAPQARPEFGFAAPAIPFLR